MASISIPEFYKNRSILITGFTGFLGKVLVEKLLRSCPDVTAVYVLVRPMKGKDCHQRVSKILESTLYDHIRQQCPENLKKIITVSGDIIEENLAISDADRQTLIDNVTVVFHCAATIKFDEDLRYAMQMNVVGTHRLLKLCHQMKDFAVFVHTSTAYANCNLKKIYEKFYPAPVKAQKLLTSLEWMNDEMVSALTKSMLDTYQRPNTYTLTKSLAEQLMHDEAANIPITIVRPSIVGSTWLEPTAGWVDNLNGATGMMVAQYKGILRVIPLKMDGVADIIPVDVVSNLLIASGWQRAQMSGKSIPIIHCTTGQLNPLTWGRMMEVTTRNCHKSPLLDYLRYPHVSGTMSHSIFAFQHAINHVVPAYFMDILARATGSKPILVRVVKKLEQALNALWYFFTQEWYFASKNMVTLYESMSDEDRKTFNFDIREMDWEKYFENYQLGIRTHLLRDDLSTLPTARRKAFRNNIVKGAVKLTLLAFVVRLLNRKTKIISQIYYYLFNLLPHFYRLSSAVRKAITIA